MMFYKDKKAMVSSLDSDTDELNTISFPKLSWLRITNVNRPNKRKWFIQKRLKVVYIPRNLLRIQTMQII